MAIHVDPAEYSVPSPVDVDGETAQRNASTFEFLAERAGATGYDLAGAGEDAEAIALQPSRVTSLGIESPSTLSPETASLPGDAWSGLWHIEDITHTIDG